MENKIQNIINKFNKKESIFETIKATSPEMRVAKLIELGVLSDLDGYTWGCLGGDRFYVFADIKGIPIPMYRTSARTGGKREDVDFFPFFGVQNNNGGQPWLIKGAVTDSNNFYESKELEETSKVLTKAFNFTTDRKKKIKDKQENNISISDPAHVFRVLESYKEVDGYVPEGKEILDDKKLNELLSKKFGMDFGYINSQPRTSGCKVEIDKILGNLK